MNEIYVLIVSGYEVLLTTILPAVTYLQNNLLFSHVEKGMQTTVKKFENNEFVEIGIINRLSGELCGAYLYDNDLMMLQYEQK
jgi:hypothetical protein